MFSVGYGLTYSTLNALVVSLAETRAIAVPVVSQVFTTDYFVGLFGFPPLVTRAIAAAGVGAIIPALTVVALANAGLALALALRSASPR